MGVRPGAVLEDGSEASATLARLPDEGISLDAVTAQLLDEGLAAFEAELATVLETIEGKLEAARQRRDVHVDPPDDCATHTTGARP